MEIMMKTFLTFLLILGTDWERLDLFWSQICRQVRLWILDNGLLWDDEWGQSCQIGQVLFVPSTECLLANSRCDQLDGDPKEVSPIFTQFLECVWQLTEQFPQVRGSISLFILPWIQMFIGHDHRTCSPLGIWIQRVVPAANSRTRALLPVRKLSWQQPEAERGAAVS